MKAGSRIPARSFIDYGLAHESAGTLEQLVIDESVRGQSIGTELVERWKSWLIAEGVPLGFASTGPDAVGFYEQCGFPTLHRTLGSCGQPNETDPGAQLRWRRGGLRT